jgi:hypothetical protein
MAITVKHTKVSTIPDDADTSLVRPSDWNADHTLVGLGTMAEQNANAVAITGGTATLTSVTTPIVQATNSAGLALRNSGGTTQISMGAGGGDNFTVAVSTNLNGTNAQIDISPTGTGHVHIKPTGVNSVEIAPTFVGEMDNITIGAITPAAGKFTTLEATGTSSLGTASAQYIQAVGDALYPQVKAVGSGTNIPLVLQPKGTGALQAQLTDSTATGGNARGANAVDWQTSRSGATQVASGSFSTLSGGSGNTSSTVYSVVSGGTQNAVNGSYSVIAGGIGNSVTASNANSFGYVGGGYGNISSGVLNFIGGGYANTGTSASAVTTQSATMNGTTSATLSGSNANIKVGQLITGTSISNFPATYVAAISGTALTLSQAASGSSTSTLSFYTPHGVVVGGGNNQATGSYSFIGGGGDAGTAANRNTASGDWSVVAGGNRNIASGNFSFVGSGFTNTASGVGSFIGGGGNFGVNTASGQGAFVGAGWGNIASGAGSSSLGLGGQSTGDYSACLGGAYGLARSIIGNTVFAASSAPYGTAFGCQGALLILARQTTDATATVLASNSTAASATNQVAMPINSAYLFKVTVIAGVTGAGDTKAWKLEGAIKKGATNASTAIVGTVTTTVLATDAGAATWAVTATADTTNGALAITATGQAATTIRWVAKVETTEMQF